MDAHNDLMEAALNAVNAVEAKKSEVEQTEGEGVLSSETAVKSESVESASVASVETVETASSVAMDDKTETTENASAEKEVESLEKPERPANAPKPAAKTARLPQFPGLAEMASKSRAVPSAEVKEVKKVESEKKPAQECVVKSDLGLGNSLDLSLSVAAFDNLLADNDLDFGEVEVILEDAPPQANPDQSETVRALETRVAELEETLIATRAADATLRQENEQLKALAKQLNDRMVRVTADFDNYKKRVVRDQEQNKNQAQERIVTGFLSVMDNLERALSHARQSNDYDQLLQGVEMTAKLFTAALVKQGCTPYDSLGAEFDPVYHDVLSRVIDAEKPHNSIVQEHLRGYMMHDRVLRPALVVVAQHEDGSGD